MNAARLICSYEESKALKEAGWSQDIGPGTYYRESHPQCAFFAGINDAHVEDDALASPRLDELLAFLATNTDHFDLDSVKTSAFHPYDVTVYTTERDAYEMFKGDELLGVIVEAVQYILGRNRAAQ